MSRKLIIIGAIFLMGQKMDAQNQLSQDWGEMFGKVIQSGAVTSRVLWDFGMADSSVLFRSGLITDQALEFNEWSDLYQTWEVSILEASSSIAPYDSIKKKLSGYFKNGIVVVPAFWVKGSKMRREAFTEGKLVMDTIQKMIEVVEPNGAFDDVSVFVSAPFIQTFFTKEINFKFSDSFFFSNTGHTISQIEYSLDQSEYIVIGNEALLKLNLEAGFHKMIVKYTMSNREVLYAQYDIVKRDIDQGGGNGGAVDNFHIGDEFGNIYTDPYRETETNEALGAFIKALPGYTNGDMNTCIKNPIIFVEGIDFGYKNHETGCYGGKCGSMGYIDLLNGQIYNPYETKNSKMYEDWEPIRNAPVFIEKLRQKGYDVFYLDFHNGADYMENNAMLLIELIKRINFQKCSREELVVIGASMGGQVTRFALSYMENNNMSHCVRTFVSFDSPNKGANIPLGFQHFIKYYAGKLPKAKDNLDRKLNRPATKQLLMVNCLSWNGWEQHSLKSEFDSRMGNLGGFPKMPRSVAVLNGSLRPIGQGFQPGDKLLEMNPYLGTLNFDILEINATLWATFEQFKDKEVVMEARFPFSKKRYAEVEDYTPTYDHIQGSNRFDLKDSRAIYGLFNIINRVDMACFIPTYSALNMRNDELNYDFDANIEKDNPNPDLHTFEAYYGPLSENQEHMMITNENMDWIINQLNINKNDLPIVLNSVYNFGRYERNTLAQLEVNSSGVLKINGSGRTGFGNGAFDRPTVDGSLFQLYTNTCEPIVSIWEKGQMIVGEPENSNGNTAIVYFRKGSTLYLKAGSVLKIHNNSKLVIEEGATLLFAKGARIILDGIESVLQIDGVLMLEDEAEFKVEHSVGVKLGFLKFRNIGGGYGNAKIQVKSGNAKVNLIGEGRTRVLLHLEGPIDFSAKGKISEFKLEKCKVVLGNTSSLQLENQIQLKDLIFSNLDWAYKYQNQALTIKKASNVQLENCDFKEFKIALYIEGHQGAIANVRNSYFENNYNGIYADVDYLKLENNVFKKNKEVGLVVSDMNKEVFVLNSKFINHPVGMQIGDNNSFSNPMVFVSNCDFNDNTNGVLCYRAQLTIACTKFIGNMVTIKVNDGHLNMSEDEQMIGFLTSLSGGNNTILMFEGIGIEVNQSVLNLNNGKNNFIYTGVQYPYSFIEGSVLLNLMTHELNYPYELKVSQNYWSPNIETDWTSLYNQIYQIKINMPGYGMSNNYFKGNYLNEVNTKCYFVSGCQSCEIVSDTTGQYLSVGALTSKFGLNFYPQPASSKLVVNGLLDLSVSKIKIMNPEGRLLEEFKIEDNEISIDVSMYRDGIYLITYTGSHENGYILFTVKH